MRDAFIGLSGLLLQIVVGFAPIFLFKMAVVSKTALGRLAGKIDASTKGLTNRAKEYGESRNFYQRRQMARDARKNEQRRGNVADYAGRITADNFRSRLLKRRAAGGMLGQAIGTVTGGKVELNRAGQQRQYVSGLSQLERQEQEEIQQAAQVIDTRRVTAPAELRAIAEGGQGRGVTGETVSGQGNTALRQAAIQKLIDAQDAEQLENLFKNFTSESDQQMLVSLLQKGSNYSTAKGAGAHFVAMQPQAGGYSGTDIEDEALKALSKLSAAKLAQQDGPAVQSAVAAFMAGRGTPEVRQTFYNKVQEIYNSPQTHDTAKGSSREGTVSRPGMDAMFNYDPSASTGTTGTAKPGVAP